MRLDNKQLHALLSEKEINYLYHANTVSTSITFIEQVGLLSRGGVEEKGLYQTSQSSDDLDKEYNVGNDVFLDSSDLHEYFSRQNHYGPVLFKINIDFLLNEDYEVWVTKDNPIYWTTAMTDDLKYFANVNELRENWDLYQRQKKMITIRNQLNPILFNYVEEVIVDNPHVLVRDTINLFSECVKGIKEALGENSILKNKFNTRECNGCYCRTNYLREVSVHNLIKSFLPSNHPEFNK